MAKRGPKPDLPHLKAVPGKRTDYVPSENDVPIRDFELKPPKRLNKVQQKLWDDYIEPAWWLQQPGDAVLGFIFVVLMAEFINDPSAMVTSRIGELRKTMAELKL
ncbi:MAG: hypothetical protein P8X82_18480, partial [Gemmatimonadales bacterium]